MSVVRASRALGAPFVSHPSRKLSPAVPSHPCRVQLLGKKQMLQEALQVLQVALCSQAKLQAQQEMLQAKVEQLGSGEPPPVPLLQEDRHSTSSSVSKRVCVCTYA